MRTAAATLPPWPGPSVLDGALSHRACDLCDHGTGPIGDRCCGHPDAGGAPVEQVRCRGGTCGPEAELLRFPGLTL